MTRRFLADRTHVPVDALFFLKRRNRLTIADPGRILVIKVDQLGDVKDWSIRQKFVPGSAGPATGLVQ